MFRKRVKQIAIGLTLILVLATPLIVAQGKTDLKIVGRILGYHAWPLSNMDGFSIPVLIKIKKVIDGSEGAEYITIFALVGGRTSKQIKKAFPLGREIEVELSRMKPFDGAISRYTKEPGFVVLKEADPEIVNSDVTVPSYRVLKSRILKSQE